MADSLSITISILALSLSVLTARLTLFRQGTVKMTQPTVIFFGPDAPTSCFITYWDRRETFPQGLKPAVSPLNTGTAEAVPFQKSVMKQLLVSMTSYHFRRFICVHCCFQLQNVAA
jgi:hypothetical protein